MAFLYKEGLAKTCWKQWLESFIDLCSAPEMISNTTVRSGLIIIFIDFVRIKRLAWTCTDFHKFAQACTDLKRLASLKQP